MPSIAAYRELVGLIQVGTAGRATALGVVGMSARGSA